MKGRIVIEYKVEPPEVRQMVEYSHVDSTMLVDNGHVLCVKYDVLGPLDVVHGLSKCQRVPSVQRVCSRVDDVVSEEQDVDGH